MGCRMTVLSRAEFETRADGDPSARRKPLARDSYTDNDIPTSTEYMSPFSSA